MSAAKPRRLPTQIWADWDPKARHSLKWAFYRTKAEQRANRPDLKPRRISLSFCPNAEEALR